VPGEVLGVGAEGGLESEGERTSVEVGEFEVATAGKNGFGDVGMGYADAEVIIDGPEAGVEEIVGGRSQGQAVVRAVRTLLRMRVDVCGL